ncbi:MAG: sn-glycerol-3-phosphate ABC transporter ATP-binding protein UgpC [Pseudomonadota bacterium]
MASAAFDRIRKSFGTTEVIRETSFDIRNGEFLVLVGPSGCGKSTLLRILAGLEDTSAGTVSIDGRVVNDMAPKDRDIAMVFQSYALYPHMTVAENMAFALTLLKQDRSVIAGRVEHAASILNLAPLLGRYPRELSGGQRQRVAMGRAIVRDPKLFLFDEPLSNLDAKLRVSMRGEIRALHQRLKATTVYVTHDQVEAMTMADRIVVMRDGRVEQIGAPLELYDSPRNLFVAQFIGSPAMNVFEGELHRTDRAGTPVWWVRDAAGALWPVAGEHDSFVPGRRVHYGVRPEDLALAAGPVPGETIDAVVSLVEPVGPQTEVVMKAGHHDLTVLMPGRPMVEAGQHVHLRVAAGRVHLFDGDSEERMDIAVFEGSAA